MTIRPDYTHVSAKDRIGSAENEADAPKGESLAYGGKLQASGRFLVRSVRSRDGLEGRRRVVTVLFADLRGSLELIAARDLDEAREILDGVLRTMIEAVQSAGGIVNQVLGDGLMALFGAEDSPTDHATAACLAALGMHAGVGRQAGLLRAAHGADVSIRVGINSGEVLVRSIETDLGRDYTAVGSPTHVAARMEQLARPGSTLITAETRRLADPTLHLLPMGQLDVKGLPEGIEAFELLGPAGPGTRSPR